MIFETLIIEIHDRVALVRLNRPDALNALNQQLIVELDQAASLVNAVALYIYIAAPG